MTSTPTTLFGYADAFPSESIHHQDAPGLAVSVLFPVVPQGSILQVPVKQFKDVPLKNKAARANRLSNWLREEKRSGLRMPGMMIADNWQNVAEFGLRQIEELPNSEVVPHYDDFRIKFGDKAVNLAHAVALQYYYLLVQLGCLRFGTMLPDEQRNLLVLLDRFPHGDTGNAEPGTPISPTPGMQLLRYIELETTTGRGIAENNGDIGLRVSFGNLDWWRRDTDSNWEKGKSQPNFKLPDWLNHAVMADTHFDAYIDRFEDKALGADVAQSLRELHSAFKEFEIYTIEPELIGHLRPSDQLLEIPDDAREFILGRIS